MGRVTKADAVFVDLYINLLAGSQGDQSYEIKDIYCTQWCSKVARGYVEAASTRGQQIVVGDGAGGGRPGFPKGTC